jgi:hypothetical protein
MYTPHTMGRCRVMSLSRRGKAVGQGEGLQHSTTGDEDSRRSMIYTHAMDKYILIAAFTHISPGAYPYATDIFSRSLRFAS